MRPPPGLKVPGARDVTERGRATVQSGATRSPDRWALVVALPSVLPPRGQPPRPGGGSGPAAPYGDRVDELSPEVLTQMMHTTIPAVGRLGVVVEAARAGEVRLRIPIEGNTNHFGTMYAGALFAVVELVGGLLPLSVVGPAYTPIVTDVHVRFQAAAKTDITVHTRMDPEQLRALAATADAEGLAHFVMDVEGKDANERTVITFQGDYQLRPSRPGAWSA